MGGKLNVVQPSVKVIHFLYSSLPSQITVTKVYLVWGLEEKPDSNIDIPQITEL